MEGQERLAHNSRLWDYCLGVSGVYCRGRVWKVGAIVRTSESRSYDMTPPHTILLVQVLVLSIFGI